MYSSNIVQACIVVAILSRTIQTTYMYRIIVHVQATTLHHARLTDSDINPICLYQLLFQVQIIIIKSATQTCCKLYVDNKLIIVIHTNVTRSQSSLIPRLSSPHYVWLLYVAKDS